MYVVLVSSICIPDPHEVVLGRNDTVHDNGNLWCGGLIVVKDTVSAACAACDIIGSLATCRFIYISREAEPGVKPIKLSMLRQKLYNQLFLPFVPQKHWFHHTPISMYKKNQQYAVHFDACRELDVLFSKALIDVQIGAKETSLNLPHYMLSLVPKL